MELWNLKTAKEEIASSTRRQPKAIILRSAMLKIRANSGTRPSAQCQYLILQQNSKSFELWWHLRCWCQSYILNRVLWGSPEDERSKRLKINLPSLKCHAIFVLNPETRFERCIFFPVLKTFITSWTTTKPSALIYLFQDCHLFPPSCQNLQLFLLAASTGQLLVVKKLQHIRSLTFGTA